MEVVEIVEKGVVTIRDKIEPGLFIALLEFPALTIFLYKQDFQF